MSEGRQPITAAQLLDLDEIGADRFCSRHSQTNPSGALYGGQVLGQGLAAALRTAPGWTAHSLHGYFLRGGTLDLPVEYRVERLRDGRRFAARRVEAMQAGRPLFEMQCSFHDPETGFDRQLPAPPDLPDPESLPSLADFVTAEAARLSPVDVRNYGAPFPLELRLVRPESFFFDRLDQPRRGFWVRMPSAAAIAAPALQQCLLAFLTDYWLAGVAAGQDRPPTGGNGLLIASLDHAMWFHRPARAEDWLYYDTDSPSTQDGRGLARGLLYDRAGRLVASTVQEAVLRLR